MAWRDDQTCLHRSRRCTRQDRMQSALLKAKVRCRSLRAVRCGAQVRASGRGRGWRRERGDGRSEHGARKTAAPAPRP
eukprot:1624334-Rhodomonas_salina.1